MEPRLEAQAPSKMTALLCEPVRLSLRRTFDVLVQRGGTDAWHRQGLPLE
jgi:hypothetical protein